mgnify:CR=1 FL=1
MLWLRKQVNREQIAVAAARGYQIMYEPISHSATHPFYRACSPLTHDFSSHAMNDEHKLTVAAFSMA